VKLDHYIDKLIDLLADYTPRVVASIVVLLVGMWLINRIAVIAHKAFERKNLDVSLRTFLKSLISIGLKVVLIITVAGMIGIGTASFVTILGAAGLAVGLALQGSLSNFAGGVLILIFKPYKVGDTIEAQGQTGEVLEIQIFNTIVLTGDHKTVIFPNGPLSNGTIVNFSRHGNLRTEIPVSVSLDNNIEHVKSAIREILDGNPLVLKQPEPTIAVGKIDDNGVTFLIRPYCQPGHTGDVISSVVEGVKGKFEQKKIKTSVQNRYVHNV
jgi:small conductance mechanosensitive channel